jgi:hypothetical protein
VCLLRCGQALYEYFGLLTNSLEQVIGTELVLYTGGS